MQLRASLCGVLFRRQVAQGQRAAPEGEAVDQAGQPADRADEERDKFRGVVASAVAQTLDGEHTGAAEAEAAAEAGQEVW